VLVEIVIIVIFIGIFGGSHEQHVFEKVRFSCQLIGVASDVNVHGGSRLFRGWVGNEEDLQLIFELHVSILSIIRVGNVEGMILDRWGCHGDD
jgi:hypothetical protein